MSEININEFDRDAVALLDRVEAGEPITVLRDGRPIAGLRPADAPRRDLRPFGLATGAFVVPDDFDAPLPDDVVRTFEGR